jgi:DUF1707 SHOCT-like domain
MTAQPGDGKHAERAAQAGRGHLRASHADRDLVAGHLKAAFVAGQLARDEFDQRLGAALEGRTYADLAALTADLPLVPAAAAPRPARRARPARPDGRRPLMPRTTTRVLAGSTALYLLTWVSAVALGLFGQIGGAFLLLLMGTFAYLLVLGVTGAEIVSQRREQRRSRGRAGSGAGPGTQVSPPRSRPRVASRSSWNWIHTRWQESRSGASIQAYCPAWAFTTAVPYSPAYPPNRLSRPASGSHTR